MARGRVYRVPRIASKQIVITIRFQWIRIGVYLRMRMSGTVYLSFRQAFAGLGEGRLRVHRVAWHETVLHIVWEHQDWRRTR